MLGGPRERSGFPPPSGRVTPPLCGLVLLRRSHVSDAKRLKELETENGRLKKLLAESQLEIEVTREVLRKKW